MIEDKMTDIKDINFHLGLIMIYPELAKNDNVAFRDNTVMLMNRGEGTFIAKWNYKKPQPSDKEIEDAANSEKAKKYLADQEAKIQEFLKNQSPESKS
jgi:hypothetical protein